jgi:hypothetical protein
METSAGTTRTRSKNKNQHPGAIEVAGKRKRRTQAQIAADKAAEEAGKNEKTTKAQEQITNIASLEGEMAQKDAEADSAHPRSRNGDNFRILYIFIPCPDVNELNRYPYGRIR